MLIRHRVARVATDPSRIKAALSPGGWSPPATAGAPAAVYYQLHGSPRKYWSRYPQERLRQRASEITALPADTDAGASSTTASGAAIENALEMMALGRQTQGGAGDSNESPAS